MDYLLTKTWNSGSVQVFSVGRGTERNDQPYTSSGLLNPVEINRKLFSSAILIELHRLQVETTTMTPIER